MAARRTCLFCQANRAMNRFYLIILGLALVLLDSGALHRGRVWPDRHRGYEFSPILSYGAVPFVSSGSAWTHLPRSRDRTQPPLRGVHAEPLYLRPVVEE